MKLMTSIKQLEKLIKPYWIGSGAFDAFFNYDEYERGEVISRLDEQDWLLAGNPQTLYKKALEKVVEELGLEEKELG